MTRHLIRPLATACLAGLMLLALPATSAADDVDCSAFDGEVERKSLNANLVVDTDCEIEQSYINGNVKFAGAFFLEIEDSVINGNIECEGVGTVDIERSRITGNIVDCEEYPEESDDDDGGPSDDDDDDHRPWPEDRYDFRASLDSFQQVPTLSTSGRGAFKAEVDREGEGLEYSLRYEDLEGGGVRFAHIHFGRTATIGGVIAFLCSNEPPPMGVETPECPAEGETLEGRLFAADVIGPEDQGIAPGEALEALRALKNGSAYINVHTEGFPGGEVRGQVAADEKKKSKKKKKKKKKKR